MLLCDLNTDDYLHILETEEHVMEDMAALEAAQHPSQHSSSSIGAVQHQQHQFQRQQHLAS